MRRGRRAVGVLLVLPALAMLLWAYVVPTVGTVATSLDENARPVGEAAPRYGTGNYAAVVEAGFGGALLNSLRLAAVPLFLVLVVAPLLAVAAQAGGTLTRRLVRVALVLPVAALAPTAVAAAGRWAGGRAADAPGERELFWWSTVGLFTALGVLGYLAVLRRRGSARSPVPGLLLVAGVGTAAVAAVTLQEFTYTYVGGPGPRGGHRDYPVLLVHELAFRSGLSGVAAAGSTVLLVLLVLLGLLVTVGLVAFRARLSVSPPGPAPPAPGIVRTGGRVVAGVLCAIVLVLTVIGLSPWFRHLFGDHRPVDDASTIATMTWFPTLLSAVLAMLVTVPAAFGIGWLRPLGRHSEWLLLPFGLFLFVGLGPLALSYVERTRDVERFDTFLGLLRPVWVSVPALFVLTLLFRGQAARGAAVLAEGRPVRTARLLLPVLPMVGVAFFVTWVTRAQDLQWPLLVVRDPAHRPGPLVVAVDAQRASTLGRVARGDSLPVDLALPFAAFVALFLVAVAVQLVYLDRVALRTGSDTDR